jgi:hypothetical protein
MLTENPYKNKILNNVSIQSETFFKKSETNIRKNIEFREKNRT